MDSEDLHVPRLVEQDFQAVSSDVASSSSGGVVNFDAVLNVAYNTVNQEQPKQVWETGIWKYILVMIVQGWIWCLGTTGQQTNPALWGMEQRLLDAESTGCAEEESFSELQLWMWFLSNQTCLGKIRERQICRGASSCGSL